MTRVFGHSLCLIAWVGSREGGRVRGGGGGGLYCVPAGTFFCYKPYIYRSMLAKLGFKLLPLCMSAAGVVAHPEGEGAGPKARGQCASRVVRGNFPKGTASKSFLHYVLSKSMSEQGLVF